MTTENDWPERDRELDRAWRAHSHEQPSPALDRAILAAAHRAVGSGPADIRPTVAEVTRPQRWWMPLAAAAVIGVVAIGILQVAPTESLDGGQAERLAPASPPPAAAAPELNASTESFKKRDSAVSRDAVQEPAKPAPNEPAPTPATPSPAPTAGPRELPEAGAAKPIAKAGSRNATNAAAAQHTEPNVPSKAAVLHENVDGKLEREAIADFASQNKLASRAPQAFPAAPQAARDEPVGARPPSGAPASAPAPAVDTGNTRKDAAMARADKQAALQQAAPGGAATRSSVEADALASAPPPALPRPAASPPGRTASIARDRESLNAAPEAATPSTILAKTAIAPDAELRDRARNPEAWIDRIRRLRNDGNEVEALRELREFRRIVADADHRIPVDLRDWLAAQSR